MHPMSQRSITILPRFYELLWVIGGLLLMVCANFVLVYTTNPPWQWQQGVTVLPLNVSCQVAAVLFVACVGGRNASTLVQLVYLIIGLTGFYAVFSDGGGLSYLQKPVFGYILGFMPASWLCGSLAFRLRPTLENIGFSCVSGLATIHLVGMFYLLCLQLVDWVIGTPFSLQQAVLQYSLHPLPSQLMLVCATTLIAFGLRRLLLY
jgi:biotin transport system substrate-specific component